jgi:NADH-ubiquinone oxidoreductase chain 4
MLTALFFIPLIGALSLLFVNKNESLMKQITLGSTIINFIVSLVIWGKFDNNTHEYQFVQEWAEISFCHFNVGIDGISLFFLLLTTFLFPIIILTSWNHKNNLKHYLLNFLILESLLIATFIVLDLLLFYIFFESILIPLFIIILSYGDLLTKEKAGFLLFLYTLAGSLFMLLSIITIYILTGTTDFQILSTIDFGTDIQKLLFAGFLIAFIVKTPLIPGHIWLGFAHVAAPIGGSVLLAGVILKLATYLALRVMIPYFPEATLYFTPLIYTLAVISIIYASLTCLRLIDVKAIIAYSSVSHMGVVVLGLFSNNLQGLEGAVILGLAHGVISPLLFIIVGDILYVRSHTRIIKYYRGIATSMPILSLIFFFATLANIGTPFSGNFIGEFMSYAGAFQLNPIITILGATGMFLSAAYSIWLFNRVSFGSASRYMSTMPDITRREFFVVLPLIIVSFILGIYPNVVLESLHLGLSSLLISVNTPQKVLLNFLSGIILYKNTNNKS